MKQNFWKKQLHAIWTALALVGVFLVLVYLVFQGFALAHPFFGERWIFYVFDVGQENNFPTYFSGILFVFFALSAIYAGIIDKARYLPREQWFSWFALSGLSFFLSIDELVQVHEQLTYHVQQAFNIQEGIFFFAWIIPYGALLIVLVFVFARFFLRFAKQTKIYIVIGASLFIFGAIGVEMLSSLAYQQAGVTSFGFIFFSSVEEILEIAGLLIALKGLFFEVTRRIEVSE